VPGLIPDDAFFTHLANRRFPVTVWLRRPEEFDYIVEPDVFHDFFGHVPLLFDRTYADHPVRVRQGRLEGDAPRRGQDAGAPVLVHDRIRPHADRFRHPGVWRRAAFLGRRARLLAVDDPRPRRLAFDLERIMRTEYQIDRYQENLLHHRFVRAADARKRRPDFTADLRPDS